MKKIGVGLYDVPISDRFPSGGIKVVVPVRNAGKREKTVSIADFPGKRE